jgi:hypothetical protein
MNSPNFNPLTTMNMMTMTQHLSQHFNDLKSNGTDSSIFSQQFINQTSLIFLQILLVSIFSGLTNYFSSSFDSFRILVGNYLRRLFNRLFGPFIKLILWLYKFITRQRPKFTIRRNVSLITSANIRNGQLFQIIQWFINSKHCIKKQKEINLDSQEIYYTGTTSLEEYDEYNKQKINFNISGSMGHEEIILYDKHEIIYYCEKTQLEIHGDIETSKRDNITYYLETTDYNQQSDIIERFCEHAIRTHNTNRVEWTQKIYHNNNDTWKEPQDIVSPTNIDSIILRKDMKEEFVTSLDFFRNNKDFYKEHGQRYKYVVVLMGYPGTGKTTLAMAYANQNKRHIYALNLKESHEGDLKYLIDSMDTKTGDLLIDDFDHYFTELGNNKEEKKEENNSDTDDSDEETEKKHKRRHKHKREEEFNKITYHEFLTVLDGVGSKDGLVIYICINDPSKLFKNMNIEELALFRERRINKIFECKLCDHSMIAGIYKNIFNQLPDMKLIKNIPIDKYAPCMISQQFISLFEKYGGKIEGKQKEINNILINLAQDNIETNQDKIMTYIKNLKDYNSLIQDKHTTKSE